MSQKRAEQSAKRKKSNKAKHGRIAAHKKQGSKLIAPMNQMKNMSPMSWMNDRLPCMLWASLLIVGMGREKSLELFRTVCSEIGNLCYEKKLSDELPKLSLFGLSQASFELQNHFIERLFSFPNVDYYLRPLALLDCLPATAMWKSKLGEPENEDWERLAEAVATTLDHQSQEATDCRWVYMLAIIYGGKLHLPTKESYRRYTDYPYYDDQKSVRPTIRSTEMTQDMPMFGTEYQDLRKVWTDAFWKECKKKTDCFFPKPETSHVEYDLIETVKRVNEAWADLAEYYVETDEATEIQPKREAAFGFCFYSLTLALETLASSAKLLNSKFTLRALAEIYITFKFLLHKGDETLWKAYRSFGAGQAKLTALKLDEVIDTPPGYIKKEHIEGLANEDIWMEFQDIEIGNWAKLDLRKMSEQSNSKDVYDAYYTWTSTFSHAQWCAVRDTVYTVCYNPLHRLHRVPRLSPRYEDGAEADIVMLVNKILELLDDGKHGINLMLAHEKNAECC